MDIYTLGVGVNARRPRPQCCYSTVYTMVSLCLSLPQVEGGARIWECEGFAASSYSAIIHDAVRVGGNKR